MEKKVSRTRKKTFSLLLFLLGTVALFIISLILNVLKLRTYYELLELVRMAEKIISTAHEHQRKIF
jgi:hypothetical protein